MQTARNRLNRKAAPGQKQPTIPERCVFLKCLFTVALQHKPEHWCVAPASICEAVPSRARRPLVRCPHTCGKERK